ncbi:hypothetical protein PTKIN_Ptkin17bG0008000 [Pterospermum kingtungense]
MVRLGLAVFVRDHKGTFLAARSVALHSSVPVSAIAEAMSFHEALSWIKALHFESVILESNALVVVNAVNKVAADASWAGLLVDDCISLVKETPRCTVSFVHRSANQMTHSSARTSVSISGLRE